MIFLFDEKAGENPLFIRGENFKYLVKVRRHTTGDVLHFRNPSNPEILYSYTVESLTPRELNLILTDWKKENVSPLKQLHIGWCMIDPKSIEKTLPMLNEIGVTKISFIYCKRSQRNFKPDPKRFERILKSSMQQCGRSSFLHFEIHNTLQEFLELYPDVRVFDFCENVLEGENELKTVLIGCEGGFSEEERILLKEKETFRLDTPMVLRSESAAVAVASKILL